MNFQQKIINYFYYKYCTIFCILRCRQTTAYKLCVRVTYGKTYRTHNFPDVWIQLVEQTSSQRVHSVRLAYAYRASNVRIPYLCVCITNIGVLLSERAFSCAYSLCVVCVCSAYGLRTLHKLKYSTWPIDTTSNEYVSISPSSIYTEIRTFTLYMLYIRFARMVF